MAVRITYNSKNVDFTKGAAVRDIYYPRQVLQGVSTARKTETLNVYADCIVHMAFVNFMTGDATDDTLKRNLYQWKQWAEAGNAWTMAYDSAETVKTTLTATEAIGSTVIDLTSVSGIDVDGLYVIRNSVNIELVKIVSVGASTVTLTEGINVAFASGDRFRAEHFWDGRLISCKLTEDVKFWDFELEFSEDMN